MRGFALLLVMVTVLAGAGCDSLLGVDDHGLAQGRDGSADATAPNADASSQPPDSDGVATLDADASSLGDATAGPDVGLDAQDSSTSDSESGFDQHLPCMPSTCAGCCGMDGECHTQQTSNACGIGGGSCGTCSAAQTCTAGACVNKCTSANCSTGCCDSSGECVTTLSDAQCGLNGAACGGCTGSNHCTQGQCGCASSADCPMYQACQANHACSNICGASATCNGGCCSAGQCTQGTAAASCGAGGATCTSCANASSGTVCLSNASCGCNSPGDCAAGTACNASTHRCTASCSGGLVCEASCCDGANCQLPNATRCSGATPQSCSSNGQWVNGAITSGQCGANCTPGSTPATCVNNAPRTCNGAGQLVSSSSCAQPTPMCSGGSCTCAQTQCSSLCTNTSSDAQNCGACSHSCSTTHTTSTPCTSGSCAPVCQPGYQNCNGAPATDDGCECAGAGCCGSNCQTVHKDGFGQNFLDCSMLGTYTSTSVLEACVARSNDLANCQNCLGPTGLSVLYQGTVYAWFYKQDTFLQGNPGDAISCPGAASGVDSCGTASGGGFGGGPCTQTSNAWN